MTAPIQNLHQFLALLEEQGELSRIEAEADPILEIAAITDRICKEPAGGRALLFQRPKGSSLPVATNLFGSLRRVCLALGVDRLDRLTERMAALLAPLPDQEVAGLDRRIGALPEFSRFAPVAGRDPDLVAMEEPDLGRFPFLQSWPGDGAGEGHGRYITLPQVFTAAPDGTGPNCGMYRCQVRGPRELGVRWHPGSGAARHFEAYRLRGEPMPVAIALGGPPAALFSAMLPLPGDLDEMTFAGFLRRAPLDLAPCRSVPLRVPAGCEVVIEGYADPAETVMEGPFGNHTGFYAPPAPVPLVRVTAVSLRADAVVPATLVGPPPMEDCWMAAAWERLLVALVRRMAPAVADIRFPREWVFHQSAIISLENPHPGMVREMAGLLWRTPWFGAARLLLFVAADAVPADLSRAAWRSINLADAGCDLIRDESGLRLALDATGSRAPRPPVVTDGAIAEQVALRWREYGV
ncbi:UbiD family decarboxylase [Geobacter sp. FeAm09]|uniref:UbiD family decarboxylase n=1 Tax=Geobacter sp. FeAm09 TaxID=2597769 RepID=UPI0011EFC96D|nr:UbiD family decarboxylase [Geobacter sp. FeAm09]QEM70028.1 UbiD family decarboxylase [Geobacter sp. FeAm09]